MADIGTYLSDDKKLMRIYIADDDGKELATVIIDAEQAETLLTQFGRVRAEMQPPVIPKPEVNPIFRDVTREAVFHVNRPHALSDEFFFAVRHPGFGWLAFALKENQGKLLAALIKKEADATIPKIIKPDTGLKI